MANSPKNPAKSSVAWHSYTRRERVQLAKKGFALPIINDAGEVLDASFPIVDGDDLRGAIHAFPRTSTNRTAIKAHLKKRAGDLGLVEWLPAAWRPRKRGRPAGAVSLTREIEEQVLRFLRAGAFVRTAAEVAGISERTLREWVARGEGRSPRPATAKLTRFARKVRKARAEARAIAEIKAFNDHVLQWLKYGARSTPDSQGWSELPQDLMTDPKLGPEQVLELLMGVWNHRLYTDPSLVVPRCANRRCRCQLHRPRTPKEQKSLLDLADRLATDFGGAA